MRGWNWLDQCARAVPDRPAVIAGGRVVTFGQLARAAAASGARLAALGVAHGDRVALLMRNRIEFVEIMHALSRLGAVLVPLDVRATATELAAQLGACGAAWLVYEAGTRDTVAAVRERHSVRAVSVDDSALAGDSILRDVAGATSTAAAVEMDAVHSIVFTSGSSGRPKGVLLTYGNHFWNAAGSALNLGIRADDRWLACLPFCHVGGLSILLRGVIYGMTVVVHERFDPLRVNDAIDADRVTILSVVANMLQRLLDARGDRPFPPWLRAVLLGGGPAPPALRAACAARGLPVLPTYGLTEAASQVATLAPADVSRPPDSCGRPLCTTDVAVWDSDGPLPAGATGQIAVRGPTVSPGYVGDASEPERADGWLLTGDVGRIDADGYLYVLGRADDVIISGGEKIHPAEVEAVLVSHPSVAEACAFGVPDPQWGEAVAACARARPGAAVDLGDLRSYARRHLAGFKVPRDLRVVDDFPRTAGGKPLRRQVREGFRTRAKAGLTP